MNLQEQYDNISTDVLEYYDYALKISRKVNNPVNIAKRMTNVGKVVSNLLDKSRKLSQSQPVVFKEIVDNTIGEMDKKNPFYSVYVSKYPLNELGEFIKAKYADVDFEKMAKYNTRFGISGLFPFSSWQYVVAIIWGVVTFLMESIPEFVFKDFGISPLVFQKPVFWSGVTLIIYLTLVLLPFTLNHLRAKKRHSFVSRLLDYLALK